MEFFLFDAASSTSTSPTEALGEEVWNTLHQCRSHTSPSLHLIGSFVVSDRRSSSSSSSVTPPAVASHQMSSSSGSTASRCPPRLRLSGCIHVHNFYPTFFVRQRHLDVSAVQFGMQLEVLALQHLSAFFPHRCRGGGRYREHRTPLLQDVSIVMSIPLYGYHPYPLPHYRLSFADPRDGRCLAAMLQHHCLQPFPHFMAMSVGDVCQAHVSYCMSAFVAFGLRAGEAVHFGVENEESESESDDEVTIVDPSSTTTTTEEVQNSDTAHRPSSAVQDMIRIRGGEDEDEEHHALFLPSLSPLRVLLEALGGIPHEKKECEGFETAADGVRVRYGPLPVRLTYEEGSDDPPTAGDGEGNQMTGKQARRGGASGSSRRSVPLVLIPYPKSSRCDIELDVSAHSLFLFCSHLLTTSHFRRTQRTLRGYAQLYQVPAASLLPPESSSAGGVSCGEEGEGLADLWGHTTSSSSSGLTDQVTGKRRVTVGTIQSAEPTAQYFYEKCIADAAAAVLAAEEARRSEVEEAQKLPKREELLKEDQEGSASSTQHPSTFAERVSSGTMMGTYMALNDFQQSLPHDEKRGGSDDEASLVAAVKDESEEEVVEEVEDDVRDEEVMPPTQRLPRTMPGTDTSSSSVSPLPLYFSSSSSRSSDGKNNFHASANASSTAPLLSSSIMEHNSDSSPTQPLPCRSAASSLDAPYLQNHALTAVTSGGGTQDSSLVSTVEVVSSQEVVSVRDTQLHEEERPEVIIIHTQWEDGASQHAAQDDDDDDSYNISRSRDIVRRKGAVPTAVGCALWSGGHPLAAGTSFRGEAEVAESRAPAVGLEYCEVDSGGRGGRHRGGATTGPFGSALSIRLTAPRPALPSLALRAAAPHLFLPRWHLTCCLEVLLQRWHCAAALVRSALHTKRLKQQQLRLHSSPVAAARPSTSISPSRLANLHSSHPLPSASASPSSSPIVLTPLLKVCYFHYIPYTRSPGDSTAGAHRYTCTAAGTGRVERQRRGHASLPSPLPPHRQGEVLSVVMAVTDSDTTVLRSRMIVSQLTIASGAVQPPPPPAELLAAADRADTSEPREVVLASEKAVLRYVCAVLVAMDPDIILSWSACGEAGLQGFLERYNRVMVCKKKRGNMDDVRCEVLLSRLCTIPVEGFESKKAAGDGAGEAKGGKSANDRKRSRDASATLSVSHGEGDSDSALSTASSTTNTSSSSSDADDADGADDAATLGNENVEGKADASDMGSDDDVEMREMTAAEQDIPSPRMTQSMKKLTGNGKFVEGRSCRSLERDLPKSGLSLATYSLSFVYSAVCSPAVLPTFSLSALTQLFCGRTPTVHWKPHRRRSREDDTDAEDRRSGAYVVLEKGVSNGTPSSSSSAAEAHHLHRAALLHLLSCVTAMHQIVKARRFVSQAVHFAGMYGIVFDDVLSRGSQYKVEASFLRLASGHSSFCGATGTAGVGSPPAYVCCSPSNDQVRQLQPRISYVPLVMSPRAGFYGRNDPVLVLDFRSLYPSMIIQYNLCYSTCVGMVAAAEKTSSRRRRHQQGQPQEPYTYPLPCGWDGVADAASWRPHAPGALGVLPLYDGVVSEELLRLALGSGRVPEEDSDEEKGGRPHRHTLTSSSSLTFAPNGCMFVKPHVRRGVLPQMLTEVLNTRFQVQAVAKELKKRSQSSRAKQSEGSDLEEANEEDLKPLQDQLQALQLALKMLANTTYGYSAASFSGRMPCVDLAEAVVSLGRRTLERSIEWVQQNYSLWGAEVVYGDTDSLFLRVKMSSESSSYPRRQVNNLAELCALGEEIAGSVSACHGDGGVVRLAFEKVLWPCMLVTKKRYCGFAWSSPAQKEPTFLSKGLETVRRDACPLTAMVLNGLLHQLFTAHSPAGVNVGRDGGDAVNEDVVRQRLTAWYGKHMTPLLRQTVPTPYVTYRRAVKLAKYFHWSGRTDAGDEDEDGNASEHLSRGQWRRSGTARGAAGRWRGRRPFSATVANQQKKQRALPIAAQFTIQDIRSGHSRPAFYGERKAYVMRVVAEAAAAHATTSSLGHFATSPLWNIMQMVDLRGAGIIRRTDGGDGGGASSGRLEPHSSSSRLLLVSPPPLHVAYLSKQLNDALDRVLGHVGFRFHQILQESLHVKAAAEHRRAAAAGLLGLPMLGTPLAAHLSSSYTSVEDSQPENDAKRAFGSGGTEEEPEAEVEDSAPALHAQPTSRRLPSAMENGTRRRRGSADDGLLSSAAPPQGLHAAATALLRRKTTTASGGGGSVLSNDDEPPSPPTHSPMTKRLSAALRDLLGGREEDANGSRATTTNNGGGVQARLDALWPTLLRGRCCVCQGTLQEPVTSGYRGVAAPSSQQQQQRALLEEWVCAGCWERHPGVVLCTAQRELQHAEGCLDRLRRCCWQCMSRVGGLRGAGHVWSQQVLREAYGPEVSDTEFVAAASNPSSLPPSLQPESQSLRGELGDLEDCLPPLCGVRLSLPFCLTESPTRYFLCPPPLHSHHRQHRQQQQQQCGRSMAMNMATATTAHYRDTIGCVNGDCDVAHAKLQVTKRCGEKRALHEACLAAAALEQRGRGARCEDE